MFKKNNNILGWLTGISLITSIVWNFGSQFIHFGQLKSDIETIKTNIEEIKRTQYPRQEAQTVLNARDRIWELQIKGIESRITTIEKKPYYITRP